MKVLSDILNRSFPSKRIDQSSDLLLLVGLFCEVLARCKSLTM